MKFSKVVYMLKNKKPHRLDVVLKCE